MTKWKPFDGEAVYDREIHPLMDKIIAICRREGMPLIASVCFSHDEDGEDRFCTTYIHGADRAEPRQFVGALRCIRDPGFRAFAITISPKEKP